MPSPQQLLLLFFWIVISKAEEYFFKWGSKQLSPSFLPLRSVNPSSFLQDFLLSFYGRNRWKISWKCTSCACIGFHLKWTSSVDHVLPEWKQQPRLFGAVFQGGMCSVSSVSKGSSCSLCPVPPFRKPCAQWNHSVVCHWHVSNGKLQELGARGEGVCTCHYCEVGVSAEPPPPKADIAFNVFCRQASCEVMWHFISQASPMYGSSYDVKEQESHRCQCAQHPRHPQRQRCL